MQKYSTSFSMTPRSSDISVESSTVSVPQKIKIVFFYPAKKVVQFSTAKLCNLEV
jgi:hypothetical protein